MKSNPAGGISGGDTSKAGPVGGISDGDTSKAYMRPPVGYNRSSKFDQCNRML